MIIENRGKKAKALTIVALLTFSLMATFFIIMPTTLANSTHAEFELKPSVVYVKNGTAFTIGIYVTPATGLGHGIDGASVDNLTFDATKLTAGTRSWGNMFTYWEDLGYTPMKSLGTVNNVVGYIKNMYWTVQEANQTLGSYMINITFTPKAKGVAAINIVLHQTSWRGNETASMITQNATIYIRIGDAPSITTPYPTNGSTGQPRRAPVSAYFSDPDANNMNIWINISNADGGATSDSWTSVGAGTRTVSSGTSNKLVTYGNTYTWTAEAVDTNGNVVKKSYSYTMRNEYTPMIPTAFVIAGTGLNYIDLGWSKGTNAYTTYIMGKQGGYPTSRSDGTLVYNGTGTSTRHGGLGMGETWYYKAWSYNVTDNVFSTGNTTQSGSTLTNQPPAYGTPSPTNGSTNQQYALTWSIPINDPNGDLFSYRISCSNGQFTDVGSSANGTKSLAISGLSPLTTYYVYVNSTDVGSGLWTREWFTFQTKDDYAPAYGTPTPTNASIDKSIITVNWSIPISDQEGDLISINIQATSGATNSYTSSGNRTGYVTLTNLDFGKTYKIYVNATDSIKWTRHWYSFTTYQLDAPSGFTATTIDRFSIDLDWIKNSNYTTRIYVEYRETPGVWSRGVGNYLANVTSNGLTHGSLDPGTTYYYRIWSYNATKHEFSSGSSYAFDTTVTNDPAVATDIKPINGSANVSVSMDNASVTISDPNGDTMQVIIRAGLNWSASDEIYNETGLTNQTIYVDPNIPDPNTMYGLTFHIWILIFDGYDWVNYSYDAQFGNEILWNHNLIYLNSTKSGYNFVPLLYYAGLSSDFGDILNGANVSWEYITYWDQNHQQYADATICGPNGTMLGTDHHFLAGDVSLVTVLENATIADGGYSPTQFWMNIPIKRGATWLGRTAENITAFNLGQNLTTYGLIWTAVYYWDQYTQSWSTPFLSGDPQGGLTDFAIGYGKAVAIMSSSNGEIRMFGW